MTRIFIVDDDAHLLLALKTGLSRKGYDISTFDNGKEALNAYRKSTPDLVILDCNMPGLSGAETADGMLDAAHRPIIMLSGMDETDIAKKMTSRGISSYLVKPMGINQLATVIDTSLARYSEMDALITQGEKLRENKDKDRHISTAVGVIMAKTGVTYETAFDKLRKMARDQRTPMRDIARDLLGNLSNTDSIIENC